MVKAGLALWVVTLSACNPYSDELPRAMCRSSRYDCRPGEACREGYCWSEGRISVVVSARGLRNVRALAIVVPAFDQVPTSPHARTVSAVVDSPVLRGVALMRINELPRLPTHLLLWDADYDVPCPGVRARMLRAPLRGQTLRLALDQEWIDHCYEVPGALVHGDHRVFDAVEGRGS